MSEMEQALSALREAVRMAPGNRELAQHYVRMLINLLRYAEVENFLKEQLVRFPGDAAYQLLMAESFYRQEKNSHALAIVETLTSGREPNPAALVLLSKLRYRSGDVAGAVHCYKQAVEHDDAVADTDFAGLLGIVTQWNDESELESELVDGRMRQASSGDDGASGKIPLERPKIKFSDIGGMDKVKEQIQIKIIYPLTHAEMYAAYGKKMGGGILMFGPPGCGKTYLARATAGEVDAKFMSIGINDVLDMWIGNSERNLHELFEQARSNRPCVLFFDEVDALGASRSDMRQSGGRHLVNQFLAEMDGVESNNDGVLILGATNAPWHIDSAFRRPGRFDRVIFVPPPDAVARAEIVKILIAGKPVVDVDVEKIAAKTADYSGADLKAVVELAIEHKLQEAIKTGQLKPISTKDLLQAVSSVKASTKEWFATARNHALYANQGGTYDEILTYLKLK